MKIANKKQMYELAESGQLGNHPKIFDTSAEATDWADEEAGRKLGVRSTYPGSKIFKTGMNSRRFRTYVYGLELFWHRNESLKYYEATPDQNLTIQGEVAMLPEHGLTFRYTTVKKHMRAALEEASGHAYGLRASSLLQSEMDQKSWDWLNELLTKYSGHVVELSVFDRPIGHLGWNTIFWEVRDY